MPPATVTVRASASSASISSIGASETRWLLLSAMVLKQWREPSTRINRCARTASCTSRNERAVVRLLVE